jgi:hypothetical protein
MDAFSFNESRYINSHIDYEIYQRDNIYVERTFVLPNDKLSVYKSLVKRGIFTFNDSRTHHAEIIVTDMNDNRSSLSFKIKSHPMKPQDAPDQPEGKLMPYNRSNSFESGNIKVYIPDGALYDTIYFSYKKSAGTGGMLSDLHLVNNIYTPVHKPYTLSIKPDTIPPGRKTKMLLLEMDEDRKKNAINSYWSDEYISAEVRSFGKFFVGIDTLAPEITASGLVQGAKLTDRKEMRIRIIDDLSGINYYEPVIDGKWALFEYDQKNDVLIYKFDADRITSGTKHNLSLKVADNKDNISFFNCTFTW